MGIPKIIHQIWYQGDDNIPKDYITYKNSWIKKNPDWEYMLWSKDSIDNLIKSHYRRYHSLFKKLPLLIQKVDMAKYLILNYYGGIYVDLDMKCIKPLSRLIKVDKPIILSQLYIDGCDERSLFCPRTFVSSLGKFANGIFVNNAFLGSVPGHIFWLDIIETISDRFYLDYKLKEYFVSYTTGPAMINSVIRKNWSKYKDIIKIIPYYYFEPCSKNGLCNTTKSFAVHKYSGSWGSGLLQLLKFLHYNQEKVALIILIILTMIIYIYNL